MFWRHQCTFLNFYWIQRLTLGDIIFKGPERALITCKKLTLSTSKAEAPDHFEVVKSWVVNDDAEMEILLSQSK